MRRDVADLTIFLWAAVIFLLVKLLLFWPVTLALIVWLMWFR